MRSSLLYAAIGVSLWWPGVAAAQKAKPAPSPTSVVVVDSSATPKVLGVLSPPNILVVKGSGAEVGFLPVPREGFPANASVLFYASMDCSGPAFVAALPSELMGQASIRGGIAYVPGEVRGTLESIQAMSFFAPSGRCELVSAPTYGAYGPTYPVAATGTLDLRGFVPPFRPQLR
jgi:hypothetical protein